MSKLPQTSSLIVDRSVNIHPSAVVDSKAELAEGVTIGPGAVVGPQVKIGQDSLIGTKCDT